MTLRPLLLLPGLIVWAALSSPATAAILRTPVTVRADEIRLGDVVEGAGKAADIVIASAPSPGRRLVLDATRVRTVAEQHGLRLGPLAGETKIVITRDSQLIDPAEVQAAIRGALARDGVTDQYRVEISNLGRNLVAPAEAEEPFHVASTRYDRRSGRFTARLAIAGGHGNDDIVRISGRVLAMIDVPVAARPIQPGERIKKSDLDWIAIPSRRLRRGTITEANALIGQTPRRSLRPGTPITSRDVEEPIVVAKGSIVIMIVRSNNMILTAKMRATESGALGQTIRLSNPRSNRIVEGVVLGPGRVSVPTATLSVAATGATR